MIIVLKLEDVLKIAKIILMKPALHSHSIEMDAVVRDLDASKDIVNASRWESSVRQHVSAMAAKTVRHQAKILIREKN